MDLAHMAISLLVGIGAGFLGSITGSGGLLSIPALLFLGLPVDVSIATNRLAAFGLISGALPRYYKAGKIHWGTALRLIPLGILGGLVGTKILVSISTDLLSVIVGVILLSMIPMALLYPNIGLKTYKVSKHKALAGYLVYFFGMVYGAFFGGGAGAFAIYTLVYFLGMTFIEANATDFVPWTFMSATALIVFLIHGLVNFKLGIPLLIGMYIGGAFGADTAVEKGNAWVRTLFIVIILISSAKLFFFR